MACKNTMLKIIWVGMLVVTSTGAFAWDITSSRSPIDDSQTVVAILEAEEAYQNRYGRLGRANMQIICEENRTALAIVLPELYTSDNGGLGEITFRVDHEPAFRKSAIAANNHGSLALVGGEAIRTIKQMLGHDRLLVRLLTVSESVKDIRFHISGIDDAIASVRRECGW